MTSSPGRRELEAAGLSAVVDAVSAAWISRAEAAAAREAHPGAPAGWFETRAFARAGRAASERADRLRSRGAGAGRTPATLAHVGALRRLVASGHPDRGLAAQARWRDTRAHEAAALSAARGLADATDPALIPAECAATAGDERVGCVLAEMRRDWAWPAVVRKMACDVQGPRRRERG